MGGIWILRALRGNTTTKVFGRYSLLSLSGIGEHWGEGEWTARDLWARKP